MMKKWGKQIVGICIIILVVAFAYEAVNKWVIAEESLYKSIELEELESLKQNTSDFFVLYYSSNCATCKKFKSDLSQLEKEDPELKNKKLYGINVEEQNVELNQILKDYNVEGVPFVIHYVNGTQESMLYEDIKKDEIKEFMNK